jgi:tetratricopeptide (TPR) repeat protein
MRALEIDSSLAEAHATLADTYQYYDWDFPRAEEEYRNAIAANPNYPTAHQWYSEFLVAMGRNEEAISEAKRAVELDPLSPTINTQVGDALFKAGRLDEAVEHLRKTVQSYPNYPGAHFPLAEAYAQKNMNSESAAELAIGLKLTGLETLATAFKKAYESSGSEGALHALLEYWLHEGSDERRWYRIGWVYARLGNKEEALKSLEKAFVAHDSNLVSVKSDLAFESFHSDPRFQSLLRRMNFPE